MWSPRSALSRPRSSAATSASPTRSSRRADHHRWPSALRHRPDCGRVLPRPSSPRVPRCSGCSRPASGSPPGSGPRPTASAARPHDSSDRPTREPVRRTTGLAAGTPPSGRPPRRPRPPSSTRGAPASRRTASPRRLSRPGADLPPRRTQRRRCSTRPGPMVAAFVLTVVTAGGAAGPLAAVDGARGPLARLPDGASGAAAARAGRGRPHPGSSCGTPSSCSRGRSSCGASWRWCSPGSRWRAATGHVAR